MRKIVWPDPVSYDGSSRQANKARWRELSRKFTLCDRDHNSPKQLLIQPLLMRLEVYVVFPLMSE